MWMRKVLGYAAAVFSVSAFGFLASAGTIAVSAAASGAADWSLFSEGGLKVFWAGLLMVAMLALPVWLAGDAYATRQNITQAGWFAKAGAAAAAASILLVSLFTLNSSHFGGIGRFGGIAAIALLATCGGALGGLVYWAIAASKARQP